MQSFNFSTRASHTSGTMQLIACLEILKRYCRLTYESPLAKKRSFNVKLSWTEMAFLNAVSFYEIFSPIKLTKNSNSLGDNLVKFLYNPLTDWKFKSASKLEPPYTFLLVYSCVRHHRRSISFSLKRNIYKCTKLLLTSKTSLGLP